MSTSSSGSWFPGSRLFSRSSIPLNSSSASLGSKFTIAMPESPKSQPIFRRNHIKRKPAPCVDISIRYPEPDLGDPFAPLWVLRNRLTSVDSSADVQDPYRSITTPYPHVENHNQPPYETPSLFEDRRQDSQSRPNKRAPEKRAQSFPLVRDFVGPAVVPRPTLLTENSPRIPVNFPSPELSASTTTNIVLPHLHHFPSIPDTSSSMLSPRASHQLLPVGDGSALSPSTSGKSRMKLFQKTRFPSFARARSHQTSVPSVSSSPSKSRKISKASISSPITRTREVSVSSMASSLFPATPTSSEYPSSDCVTINSSSVLASSTLLPPVTVAFSEVLYNPQAQRSTATDALPPQTRVPNAKPSINRTYTVVNDSLRIRFDVPNPNPPGSPPASRNGFHRYRKPTPEQLAHAAQLDVISQNGLRVPFGDLWKYSKTIVCFIRHFWCPLCQDYMFSISRNISPAVLRHAGVNLVIISNGSFEMIKAYRKIFRTPFEVYTDRTLRVYNALGMTLQTTEAGPEAERGSYVRHGLIGGIGMVVANAIKSGMPLFEHGGEISQLGGEFVLGPGLRCCYAHRMHTTRAHAPILHVVRAAGVDMYAPLEKVNGLTGRSFHGMTEKEEAEWMISRKRSLAKLRRDKNERRGGRWCEDSMCGRGPWESEEHSSPLHRAEVSVDLWSDNENRGSGELAISNEDDDTSTEGSLLGEGDTVLNIVTDMGYLADWADSGTDDLTVNGSSPHAALDNRISGWVGHDDKHTTAL